MPDDVAARLQRVDERLRDCYTQQTRIVEDITSLQKKRQFLQSLGEPIDHPGERPKSPPAPQPRPSPPHAAADETAEEQAAGQPRAAQPSPPSNLDALLVSAQAQVSQILRDSRLFAAKTQDIVGVLTAINNVLVLAGPEGRPRLNDLGRNLMSMMNGIVQEIPSGGSDPLQPPSPGTAGAQRGGSVLPQILALLQSPVIEALLTTLTAAPKL